MPCLLYFLQQTNVFLKIYNPLLRVSLIIGYVEKPEEFLAEEGPEFPSIHAIHAG
jgi:hypothetical protein